MAIYDSVLSYQRERVSGASAVGLVVMLYDSFVGDLRRAIMAIQTGNIQQKTNEINHALLVLQQLDGSLDMEQGGDLAKNLTQFYGLARAALLEAQFKNSATPLESQIDLFLDLRAAWQQIDSTPKTQPSSEGSNPTSPKADYHDPEAKSESKPRLSWVG